jgi:hypothetical protein
MIAAILFLLGTSPAPEQPVARDLTPTTGGMKALVRDAQGRPGVGVKLHFKHADGRRWVAATDAQGAFLAGGLPPGDYLLTLEREGRTSPGWRIRIRPAEWLLGAVPGPKAQELFIAGPAVYESAVKAPLVKARPGAEKIPMH